MDNGPELTAHALHDWCRFSRTGTSYIEPGSPWENPFIESFNGKPPRRAPRRRDLRDTPRGPSPGRGLSDDYNTYRPHSALGMLTPAEFAGPMEGRKTASAHVTGGPINGVRSVCPSPVLATVGAQALR